MDLSFSSQDKSCHEHSDIGWNGGTFPEDLKVHLRCGIAAALPLSGLLCCAFSQDKAAVSAAEAACWPRDVGFKATGGDESQHPTPTRENGKALIYV
jgi:hypothetical protein